MKRLHLLSAVLTASLLAACGGGGDGGGGFAFIGSGSGTGLLKEPPVIVASLSTAQIDAGTAQNGLQPLSGKARCDVNVVSLNYGTLGPKGEATAAVAAAAAGGQQAGRQDGAQKVQTIHACLRGVCCW